MKSRRNRILVLGSLALEVLALWTRGYPPFGGKVAVRCHRGHLFTTIWIPAVSFKALRLGWWRVQRCPVGRHWTVVVPVRRSELAETEREAAAAHTDVPIP